MASKPASLFDRDKMTGILLLVILFSAYFMFFAPRQQQAPANATGPATTVTVTKTSSPVLAADTSTTNEDGAGTERDDIVEAIPPPANLEAPLYTVSNAVLDCNFSAYGGDIYQIELARAASVRKGPVVTAYAPSNAWEMPLRIRQFGSLQPAAALFAPEQSSAAALSLTATVAEALFVRKTFILTNGYLLNAQILASNVSAGAISLSNAASIWLGRINPMENVGPRGDIRGCDVETMQNDKLRVVRVNPSKHDVTNSVSGSVQWLAVRNKYFAHVLIPSTAMQLVSAVSLGAAHARELTVWGELPFEELAPGAAIAWDAALYAGPKSYHNLQTLPQLAGHGTQYLELLNLGRFAFIAKPIMLYGLGGIYRFTHSYGWAIIILTIIIKLLTWPLQTKSFESMQRMQKLQPELKALQEKYKGEPQKLQQEQMLLYRKHGVNPMGGCLPILLQIPIFFALYSALNNSVELWGTAFWYIKDLTMPDTVYTLPFNIPFLGDGVNPMPLLMTAATIIQQALTPHTGDKTQKQMMYLMPIIFLGIFYKMPSGLVLYWFVNQLLSAVQMLELHYFRKKA